MDNIFHPQALLDIEEKIYLILSSKGILNKIKNCSLNLNVSSQQFDRKQRFIASGSKNKFLYFAELFLVLHWTM